MKQPAHLSLHPFGQIPTFEDDGTSPFESSAIVLHVAQRHGGRLYEDDAARANTLSRMFAALNTVESPILERDYVKCLEVNKNLQAARVALVDERNRTRTDQLVAAFGDAN